MQLTFNRSAPSNLFLTSGWSLSRDRPSSRHKGQDSQVYRLRLPQRSPTVFIMALFAEVCLLQVKTLCIPLHPDPQPGSWPKADFVSTPPPSPAWFLARPAARPRPDLPLSQWTAHSYRRPPALSYDDWGPPCAHMPSDLRLLVPDMVPCISNFHHGAWFRDSSCSN